MGMLLVVIGIGLGSGRGWDKLGTIPGSKSENATTFHSLPAGAGLFYVRLKFLLEHH